MGKFSRSKVANLLLVATFLLATSCHSQETQQAKGEQPEKSTKDYVFKEGSYNGIGKWYMGREIAHVMGYQGIDWLERSEREQEERTAKLIENMNIEADDVIADIGAGSGYHVFKMAPLADQGKIYAVDIQQEMLDAIKLKKRTDGIENIELVKGEEQSTNLPKNSVDKVLMVDVYHEFSLPKEMLESIQSALKVDGRVYLIEYRMEDPDVPIKTIHKMSEAQAVKEFKANGFLLEKNLDNLSWQHCMVFKKEIK